ncbi:MAG: pyruvate, phosphate dikinase [SAR324 cluster bacterium]|uniref:Pyruvate, phosphate dikinase n=1 Tax=SAR324 cluster bacterium TaxID=2024889 RepID=A0A2A4T5A4_9DELT|nr:MAG: pyruvate, phosphate dikinase [SAR324 cluster bacterium]
MDKRIYLFNEGCKNDRQLLGGKGANLCEMTALGLPVPFGFVISTSTCREFFQLGEQLPEGLLDEYKAAVTEVEKIMGSRFGDPQNPLLFSVRSGAAISMPGMMDSILNLGMNDEIAKGLARKTGNSRFAYDTYRRFLQMFGTVVLGVENVLYKNTLQQYKLAKGYQSDTELQAEDWKVLVRNFLQIASVPEDPWVQLEMAIQAVFQSWNTDRALVYREMNQIPKNLGTAVTVQSMVYGNFSEDSGSGVAFTRNPATGERVFYGEFLQNAAGEDVVSGIRTPQPIEQLAESMPEAYRQLYEIQDNLEQHYQDMQDLEFTIQEGKLYMLQTREGKRTGRAAVKIAVEMVEEGLIDEQEALLRISPEQIEAFLHPMIDPEATKKVIATGLPASPGGVTGRVVFSADDAVKVAATEESVILVRQETTPEDIHGMKVASGILTAMGGMTSHAAVVARGMGVCAITGCGDLSIDYERQQFITTKGEVVEAMDVISLDGSKGEVLLGNVRKVQAASSPEFQTLLGWADRYRQLAVWANAETLEDAQKAKDLGAEGIGLCRTEHMFFDPERIVIMRLMILAETFEEREEHLRQLFNFQQKDMKGLFRIMDGAPVTIRLLDPPLHEFLPHQEEEVRALALHLGTSFEKMDSRIKQLDESNPMLGFRGCRLSIVYPEITKMQVQAIISAALEVCAEGIKTIPEIMIPLVTDVREIEAIVPTIKAVIDEIFLEKGTSLSYRIGTMMETPRACLLAEQIAPQVEFMSFGTNDLTQMTYGFSRDDIGKFLPVYLKQQILEQDPFIQLDISGVGRLMKNSIEESRLKNPALIYGICGEHGGDPSSIQFCHDIGLNYISCSPYRVPVARLAAAQAHLRLLRKK